VGYCSSDDGYKEAGILGSEVEIKHHEKTKKDNYASSFLVDNVPIDEGTDHTEERRGQVAQKLKHCGARLQKKGVSNCFIRAGDPWPRDKSQE
jgi:hypothetical protein